MKKFSTLVGMDVHARSITCTALVVETGEYRTKRLVKSPKAGDVAAWLSTLPQPAYCAYESGCTSFELARGLRKLGHACDVIAVTTLPKSPKDRQQKCDERDSRMILSAIANPASTHTVVDVPDEETEAARDLARMHADAVAAVKRAKQQLLALLLRHGITWDERTASGTLKAKWTTGFYKWLDGIEMPTAAGKAALDAYRRQLRACGEVEEHARRLVEAEAASERWKPYVDALKRLKGLDTVGAFLAAAEFGDFSRFRSGRKVSCWVGCVPKDSTSDEKKAHGSITKAGNSHLRRTLVEGCCSIGRRNTSRKRLEEGQEVSEAVERIAAKANSRLLKRYKHLTGDNGKHPNKAKVAVVSEMARWIWVIGLQVQSELAAAKSGREA